MTASFSPSSLPLSLLLAATRLAALFDPSNDSIQAQSIAPLALSFPAAYAEYVRLLTSAKTSASISGAAATPGRVWGRDVARESWEKLVTWGLVTPVGSGNGTADGQMFRVEISFEEVVEMAGTGEFSRTMVEGMIMGRSTFCICYGCILQDAYFVGYNNFIIYLLHARQR